MGFRPSHGEWARPSAGTYVVTGGAGFIGSHLVEKLVRDGFKVRVLDNLSTGKKTNLLPVMSDIELVEGDIRDIDTCLEVCRGAAVVLHQAALPSVPRSIEDPHTTTQVNVLGTLNMLDAARREKVKKFVFASSSSVYGDTPVLPKVESMHEFPKSPYAASKLAGEKYCATYAACYGLPTVSLRYFNVFGTRQDPNSPYSAVIPRFLDALRQNKPPTIYGNGKQTRDFTFVNDVVQANLLAAWSTEGAGDYFNIGGGGRYSIMYLAETLIGLTGSDQKPVLADPRPGDVRDSQAGIRKARRILGYKPEYDLESGLEEILRITGADRRP